MAKSGMEASFYECRATIIRLFRRYIIYGKKKLRIVYIAAVGFRRIGGL